MERLASCPQSVGSGTPERIRKVLTKIVKSPQMVKQIHRPKSYFLLTGSYFQRYNIECKIFPMQVSGQTPRPYYGWQGLRYLQHMPRPYYTICSQSCYSVHNNGDGRVHSQRGGFGQCAVRAYCVGREAASIGCKRVAIPATCGCDQHALAVGVRGNIEGARPVRLH